MFVYSCRKSYYVTTRNESPVLIIYIGIDRNAGDSTVQSKDDVKDDPCAGFLLVAHCCHNPIQDRHDQHSFRC